VRGDLQCLTEAQFRNDAGSSALWTTLRSHLLWLITGPLLVGAITFVSIDWAPKRYTSTSLLNPGAGTTDLSDPSLAAWHASLLKTLPSLMVSPEVLAAARTKGAEIAVTQVKTQTRPAEGTISVAVTAASPGQAQHLAQVLLEAAMAASGPKNDERARLEAERDRLTDQIRLLEKTSDRLREALSRTSTPQETGTLASAVPTVMEHTVTLEKRLTLNTARLNGLTTSAIVTPPSLPTAPTGPRRSLWAAIAALATLCLLLSTVLLQQAWRDRKTLQGLNARCTNKPQDGSTER
jgi:hypothetical protein